jgi:hypothetical protein
MTTHHKPSRMLALCHSWDILALMYASRKRFDKIEHVLNDSTLSYLGAYLYDLVIGCRKLGCMVNFRMPGLSQRQYQRAYNGTQRYIYEFSLDGYIKFMRQRAVRVLTGLFCKDLVNYIADMCANMYLDDIKWFKSTEGRGTAKIICDEVLKRMHVNI